ncbi:CHAT domain-containing protein [Streptomyces hoynatensis]|uniref:CHAT domain-containing protein n=1 Tax=Streptomyces hoynatensis TaxID=1141874 RepID=A0A3A9YUR8_9ACTN|nr:CHAT domain-containing protein [Streptomyces hoynatensis]RKN38967.1 CHAT domain-containing protein [Streptomyces hoynatensis]
MSGIADLLTGDLDHVWCEAGCRQDALATVAFHDSEAGRLYVAPGEHVAPANLAEEFSDVTAIVEVVADHEKLRRVARDLIDRRVRVFLPVMTGGAHDRGDARYLCDNWRLFTAPVMAAAGVAMTGRVPGINVLASAACGEGQDHVEGRAESLQARMWTWMLRDWSCGLGVGTWEEDLSEYVDRTAFLGDPLRFAQRLADVPPPTRDDLASMDTYRQEALRASLHARVGEPDPLADRWALIWLWWELKLRIAGGRGVAEVPGLAVSVDRLHRTIPPDSARYAGAELLGLTLTDHRNGVVTRANVETFMRCMQEAYHEAGFGEQHLSLYDGTRLHHPIEEVADLVIAILNRDGQDVDALLRITQAESMALVEARRSDDLKRVADAMRAAHPAKAAEVTVWYCRQLFEMRMPNRLIEEAGEAPGPDEDQMPVTARCELLELRASALRALGRRADALALLDSAPQEVLDEPTGKQGLGIARARLVRELGSPATALAQLEALLAETTDPQPPLHETLMATLLRFGRYTEAAAHARAAYTRALRDRAAWQVGRFAAQALWCQAIGGREPDADLIGPAMGEHQPADPSRDLFAATAFLIRGATEVDAARRAFVDRVRAGVETVLKQAQAERDAHVAHRALYLSALYDETHRPDTALRSWVRMPGVLSEEFGTATFDAHLYIAAHCIRIGLLARARQALTSHLNNTAQLGHDSGIGAAALAGGHTASEVDLVTSELFAEPGATQADLRLAGELRRGMAGRAVRREGEKQAWRQHGLDDAVVAEIAPGRGRVGVLEWVSDGTDTRALITVVDAAGSVAGTAVPLPDADLGRVARRMRWRLSTWRAGRAGDPFGVAGWHTCRAWLDQLLDEHLEPDDHLVVIPFAGWRDLPWHVAAFDRVTCSYEPGWVALLSTVTGRPAAELRREGVVAVPRVGDPAEITGAMARYVADCGAETRVLEGVDADRGAVTDLLANVDLAHLLAHGYTSAEESEVALMLAADGSLPLAHSVAASGERGRRHRFGWREYAELTSAPRVILSAACGTGGSHIVGLGEHLGLYNVLRQVGLRSLIAPQWDIVASHVLPVLGEIRALLVAREAGLGQCVRQAVRHAIHRGVPAWSAHALILEGAWH